MQKLIPYDTYRYEGHTYSLYLVKDLPGAQSHIGNHKYPWETQTRIIKLIRFGKEKRSWHSDALIIMRDDGIWAETSHSYEGHLSAPHWKSSIGCMFNPLEDWKIFIEHDASQWTDCEILLPTGVFPPKQRCTIVSTICTLI